MTLYQIRRRVDSLKRKFAVELTVVKLRPAVDEYCDWWQQLIEKKKLPPAPNRLLQKIPGKGCLRYTFPAISNYLDRCRIDCRVPLPNMILRFLVPKAVDRGLLPVPRWSVATC